VKQTISQGTTFFSITDITLLFKMKLIIEYNFEKMSVFKHLLRYKSIVTPTNK